jgi:hypothetical protein
MADLWPSCGYRLLDRADDGHVKVTDAYLRTYFERPELALVAAPKPRSPRLPTRTSARITE